MKVTIVPAQITTIEDRIIGKLGLSQLLLLITPVFGSSALYIALPPVMHSAVYKLITMCVLVVLSGVMAIRFRGKLLLFWMQMLLRYHMRPRYYIADKNSLSGRIIVTDQKTSPIMARDKHIAEANLFIQPTLSTSDLFHTLEFLDNPLTNLKFEITKKGVLRGLITKTEK